MTPGEVAMFLAGCGAGVLAVAALSGVAMCVLGIRDAVREGTQLDGEAIERAKRRGEL